MVLPSTWCWQSVTCGMPAAWLPSGMQGLALLWFIAFGFVWLQGGTTSATTTRSRSSWFVVCKDFS
ncbi:unnamed protein product [Amoebophrya sp. A25]|nr:unnamed protein product [Amoebophrya sp. A25]|eukprot:GSA25T00015069001.1